MRKSKLIAISVAGLLGLSSFVAVTGRIAHTETVYYSDATKTLPVGYETIPCEGRVILEGTRTAYATEVNNDRRRVNVVFDVNRARVSTEEL